MDKIKINYYETYKKKYPDVVKTTIGTVFPFNALQAANLAHYVADMQKTAVVGIVKNKESVDIYTSAQLAAEQSKVDSVAQSNNMFEETNSEQTARRLRELNVPEEVVSQFTEKLDDMAEEVKQIGRELQDGDKLYNVSQYIVKLASIMHRSHKLTSEEMDIIEEYRKRKEASNEEEKI